MIRRLLYITTAALALLAGSAIGRALAVTAAATAGAAPICIGLIVTGCATEPARTSPLAFLVVLILGAVAVQWMNLQARQHPVDDEDETPSGSRRLDEEESKDK